MPLGAPVPELTTWVMILAGFAGSAGLASAVRDSLKSRAPRRNGRRRSDCQNVSPISAPISLWIALRASVGADDSV